MFNKKIKERLDNLEEIVCTLNTEDIDVTYGVGTQRTLNGEFQDNFKELFKQIADVKNSIGSVRGNIEKELTVLRADVNGLKNDLKVEDKSVDNIWNAFYYGSTFSNFWTPEQIKPKNKIEVLEQKLTKLAKSVGLEYKEETTDFKGFKPVKKEVKVKKITSVPNKKVNKNK